jgi:hypothetical protein
MYKTHKKKIIFFLILISNLPLYQYCSNIFSAIMGLLWIPAYWNSSGERV